MALIHGGDLTSASKVFNLAPECWADLSTGISPWSWPVPAVPELIWQSLPDRGAALIAAASAYYGCDLSALLATPGSQYALQHIPVLIDQGAVAVPTRGYAEHQLAWGKAGHNIVTYDNQLHLKRLIEERQVKHAVVINPNNPTGEVIERELLLQLHQQLQLEGGWLLIDEAFMDVSPGNSLISICPSPGLIVLRSLGKFFGLAGLRLGFVATHSLLLKKLADQLPPWSISHPAQWVGAQALMDSGWCSLQRRRLKLESNHWLLLLEKYFPQLSLSASHLFVSGRGKASVCEAIYLGLGQRGVLVRLFDDIAGQRMIRLGLPSDNNKARVIAALRQVSEGSLCAND